VRGEDGAGLGERRRGDWQAAGSLALPGGTWRTLAAAQGLPGINYLIVNEQHLNQSLVLIVKPSP